MRAAWAAIAGELVEVAFEKAPLWLLKPQAGWLDERAAVLETLTAIRRAGADIVISYHAKDAARWLRA